MPDPIRTNELFAAFHESRDSTLLGEVFERTAPALLRHARQLVTDQSDAEDLVQGVFLLALTSLDGYEPDRPCLPYLHGVLRYRAKQLARRRRDQTSADLDPITTSSPPRLAEHTEFESQVTTAIETLESPSREVVRLYLEGHERPREIARTLGRSPGTVRVQLHRGLAKLRTLLPSGTLLLVIDSLAARSAASATTVGSRRSWRRLHVALGATVALTALVAVASRGLEPVGTQHPTTSAVSIATAPMTAAAHVRDNNPREPAADAGRPAPATATLQANLRWAETDQPATAIGATLARSGHDPMFHGRRARADADGIVQFEELQPGDYVLQLDRGPRRHLAITAGANEFDVRLPNERRLSGRVVDRDGQPVPAAAVWVSDRPGHIWNGQIVGHANADGCFELHGVTPRMFVTVRADGFAAPPLQTLTDVDRQHVDFELPGPAAAVAGTVVDARGAPVREAFVLVGTHPRAEQFVRDATSRLDATRVARTDAVGAFSIDGLTAGNLTAIVRHEHYGTAVLSVRATCTRPSPVCIELRRGRIVTGTVQGPDGTAIRDAFVHCSGGHRRGWAAVRTDSAGAFTLAGIPHRDVTLTITADRYQIARSVAPVGTPDLTLTLTDTPIERGRVHNPPTDQPLTICLDRRDRSRRDGPPPILQVAADGSFQGEVPGGFDLDRVFVSGSRQLIWIPVAPQTLPDGSLDVLLPETFVQRGTIELSLAAVSETVRDQIRLLAVRDSWTYRLDTRRDADLIRSAPIVPGNYQLFADSESGTFPAIELGTCVVRADQVTRLGPVRAPHGFVEFAFSIAGELPRQLAAWVQGPDGIVTPLRGFRGRQALTPGKYRLSCRGDDCAPLMHHPFRVAEDHVTDLTIDLPKGQPCELAWESESDEAMTCRILDAKEELVMQVDRAPDASRAVTLAVVLAPGSYTLATESETGTRHAAFEVVWHAGELALPLCPTR